jgi:predicted permease
MLVVKRKAFLAREGTRFMVNILTTILPIFVIILVGWGLRRLSFMKEEFLGPANQLVYFVAIPAMIFRETARAGLAEHFSFILLGAMLTPVPLIALGGLIQVRGAGLQRAQLGTFLQCSFHGNLGYIGLAVAYYFLGNEGFTRASILAGFLMLLQNFLAVTFLSRFNSSPDGHSSPLLLLRRILLNPIIISATAGMIFSLSGLVMPVMLDRSLGILSGMALPLALLLIGSSLSFTQMRRYLRPVFFVGLSKLVLLPAVGLAFFHLLALQKNDSLPALILLASPTATVAYVMAREMAGDQDLATAAISVTTLVSALTFIFWLSLGS